MPGAAQRCGEPMGWGSGRPGSPLVFQLLRESVTLGIPMAAVSLRFLHLSGISVTLDVKKLAGRGSNWSSLSYSPFSL